MCLIIGILKILTTTCLTLVNQFRLYVYRSHIIICQARQKQYYKQWRWWLGFGFVVLGAIGDFTSLSFAPQR